MIDYIRSFYKEEILFAFLSKYYKYTFFELVFTSA